MAVSPIKLESKATNDSVDFKPGDRLLLKLCVETLKDVYPKGVTIKELANIMTQRHKELIYLFKCSTILSTKLNAFYRRCHPDDPRQAKDSMMALCPILRIQSDEAPRRLLYKYASIEDLIAQKNSKLVGRRTARVVSPPPDDSSNNVSSDEEGTSEPLITTRSRPINQPTPPAEDNDVKPSPYQLRKVIKRTPHAYSPMIRRKSSSHSSPPSPGPRPTSVPADVASKPSATQPGLPKDLGANPYYDNNAPLFPQEGGYLDYQSHDSLSTTSWIWADGMSLDLRSPESISLDDLNDMF